MLISNKLSYEVLEFLRYKVKYQADNRLRDIIYKTFQIMLRDGMTFYTNNCYKNVIDCEFMILSNMLEIIHIWEDTNLKFDDIYKYIKTGSGIELNLSGMDLRKIDWDNIDLSNVRVKNINLGGVNLEKLNLKGAKFEGADLTEADFSGAKLFGAKFIDSKLVGADFTRARLNEADLTDADLTGVKYKSF